VNPLTLIQSAIAAAIAFVLGALIAGIPGYFVGRSHGAASKLESIGALKTSVDSCTVAAQETRRVVDAEVIESKGREQRITGALADNAKLALEAARKRSQILGTPVRGDTECEQTKNAINDVFRGKR
jgi:hypothetical protein